MTGGASFLADAWVSLCAALGAVVVLLRLGEIVQRPEIASRFRFCLWVLAILMLARIGHWGGWGWLFSVVANCCAALVPLAALLLAEGLLRRHAPAILKQTCAWGAVAFALLGLLQFSSLEVWRLFGMLLFQLVGLVGVALLVQRRDHGSLSTTENSAINQMSLSFLLILPFLATDYMRFPTVDVPVRLGGVAVLVLCWLSISLNRPAVTARDILRGFVIVFAVTSLLTLILAGLVPMDLRAGLQVMAVIVSALVLLAIWQAATALRTEDRQLVALREIAEADGQGPEASMALLRRAAGAPDAVLVAEPDLSDMNLTDLRARFDETPVLQLGTTGDEQVNWLFSRFDATHAVLLSADPFRVAMLNSPDIAVLDSSGAGLRAVQRMARILMTAGHR
ncbi:hypothetical protein [Ruegeria meonggei]|uniref:Uncharacterized protein n=1 Tax=Ruegeria meonggei TaxID=1446476 RepID=A0A1X6YVL7_9RHOB|nr:hypothetical protein [Ruegeria meonggei]SLN32432.1 hypothetical protein RUM8411_01364 [Ruegeria meonggei]